jgi:hypothetical protein
MSVLFGIIFYGGLIITPILVVYGIKETLKDTEPSDLWERLFHKNGI